jgi:hypothetical protein
MIKVIPISLALIGCSYTDENYLWFEDDWISDAPRTISENRKMGVSEELLETYSPMYGTLRWHVVGRTITFIHESGYEHSSAYTLSSLSDSELQLVSNYGIETTTRIEKTNAGFCARFNFEWLPSDIDVVIPPQIECFRRNGT